MGDGIPIGLLLLFALCLFGSFFFSATEMAFSSVSRIRMRSYAENGDKRAGRVLSILDRFDDALTTLLIGNNIVNISCATIATIIATNRWGMASVSIATLVTTVLLFMLGETLPKSFAKACNESYAMATAGVLFALMKAFRPLVILFGKVTRVLARPFHLDQAQPTVTEDELRDIIDDAVEEGSLNEETGKLVKSAFRYGDATVRDILTPWRQVQKLPASTAPEDVLARVKQSHHSRLPVINGTGEIIGMIRVRRYLKQTVRTGVAAPIDAVLEPVQSVAVTTPVDELLPRMSNQRAHFMLVRDEWENVLGIVTVEDILERLVGDIWDEEDEIILAHGGDAG